MVSRDLPRVAAVRRPLAVLVILAGAAMLSACNTTEGVGRDVKSLGKGVEETAQENKPR